MRSDPFLARAELGEALYARAGEVAPLVIARLGPLLRRRGDEPAWARVVEELQAADRLATEIVARWLSTGEGASEEERQRLASIGGLADEAPLALLVKSHLSWRDATLSLLAEEAARLQTPEPVAAAAAGVVERSCDAAIVRTAGHFDRVRRRLQRELALEHQELAWQATHDSLTGLANRALLRRRLQAALVPGGSPVSLAFLDVDGFKEINDRFGHDTGDRVLVALAARLGRAARSTDLVARLGGDEFVVLAPGLADPAAVRGWVERLMQAVVTTLRSPAAPAGQVPVSASVGVTTARPGARPESVLREADAAMYRAKSRGGAQAEVAAPG